MKKKLTILHHIILIIVCITLVIGVVLKVISLRRLDTTFKPIVSKESSTAISNPFCGFYQLEGYTPTDKKNQKNAKKWWKKHCEKSLNSLLLLEFNLKNYSKKNLSDQAISQITTLLDQCSLSKKQVILRFLYDWDGKASKTEPDHISQIKTHISQLSVPVNDHKGYVYMIQGLFIGNYGELHHSKFHSESQLRELALAMNESFDSSIYLAVRTPAQLRSILQTDTPEDIKDEPLQSLSKRLGLFNDGILGSDTDLGTYDNTPVTSESSYSEPGTRAQEIRFQSKLCQFVPNGGEVIFHKDYSNLMNAVDTLSAMHVSYLNQSYDPKVIKQWQHSIYTGDGIFSKLNGYYYIKSHLGYRYILRQANLDFHSFVGDQAYLYLTIENSGFAPAYRAFDTYLILTDQKTMKSKTVKTNIDNRNIAGEDKTTFKIPLNIRSFKKASYHISLKMTDPYTKESIHFANSGYENSNEIPVGLLTIK